MYHLLLQTKLASFPCKEHKHTTVTSVSIVLHLAVTSLHNNDKDADTGLNCKGQQ